MKNLGFQKEQYIRLAVVIIMTCVLCTTAGGGYLVGAASSEKQISVNKQDNRSAIRTAIGYMNKARDTGDDQYYSLAQGLVDQILKEDPNNYEALRLQAWILSGQHQFTKALSIAEHAAKINPSDSANYGVMVDALVELGRYKEAVDAAQRMVNLRPGLSSYSRISYLRWLYGDLDGSDEALKMAIRAGVAGSPEVAWCVVQLGNNYFNRGRLNAAEEQYKVALRMVPGYVHALAGMGKIKAARGDYRTAIKFYEKASLKNPSHDNAVALGDLYMLIGDRKNGEKYFRLVEKLAIEKRAYPETGLKMAVFYTDHDLNLPKALRLAQLDANSSDDISAWDALAWAYYKNGQYMKARKAIRKALRLGTKDARLFFHAGMIYEGIGDNELAKKYLEGALSLNPYFDLRYPATARSTLTAIKQNQSQIARRNQVLAALSALAAFLLFTVIIWVGRRRRS